MTANETTKYAPLTYRRPSTACFLLAGTAAFVGALAGYLYVAVALYAALGIDGFGIRHATDATLYDERDSRFHDRASGSTISIISYTGIVSVPVVVGLAVAGYIPLPPEWFGFMMAFPALMGVYSVAYIYHRYR